MRFEYDENKSRKNREKHGIDFIEAQMWWQDKDALVVPANIVGDETRYALIAKYRTKCFIAIFVIRDGAYRIINVRRCRKKEEKHYEQNNG